MKKHIWAIFILLGIGLMLYPTIKYEYYKSQEEKFMENWDKASTILESSQIETSVEENQDLRTEYEIHGTMIGIINIKKIDLYEPVLKGASENNLNIGMAWVEGTAQIGDVGNHIIVGHRSRRYGRHFNRLDELEKGDTIEIITKDTSYIYIVYDKLIVKAEDARILEESDGDKIITLITCDYSMKPTGRLVVRGRCES